MTEKSPDTHRLFLAAVPDETVTAALADICLRLQNAARFTSARIAWVPQENFHITLYFLGDVAATTAARLASDLPFATREVPPFDVDLRKIDFFPKEDRRPPKVLWAGIHNPSVHLAQLRKNCAGLIARAALPVPDQEFSPHVTLARLKSTAGLSPFRDMVSQYRDIKFGKCRVDRLILMESHTGGGPARYSPYASAPLEQAP